MERSTIGSLLRSTQSYCQQICEKQTFDFGIAFHCARFPALPEANQIREVTLDDPQVIAEALEQTNSWFASRGLRCFRWSAAMNIDPEPLTAFLNAREFKTRKLAAFHLTEWKSIEPSSSVRILPARAVRQTLRESFVEAPTPADTTARDTLADSFMERLDDPQLDMFVATVDKKAAGRCGLYQVGDIARILDLTVLPEFADSGVAESLLIHALAMARRLTMPMVVAQAEDHDLAKRKLFNDAGFVEYGHVYEFESPSPFSTVAPV